LIFLPYPFFISMRTTSALFASQGVMCESIFAASVRKPYSVDLGVLFGFRFSSFAKRTVSRYSRPEIVNTDQGSQFTATEFVMAVRASGCRLEHGRPWLLALQRHYRTPVEVDAIRVGVPAHLRHAGDAWKAIMKYWTGQ
jgi:hypothetical protein